MEPEKCAAAAAELHNYADELAHAAKPLHLSCKLRQRSFLCQHRAVQGRDQMRYCEEPYELSFQENVKAQEVSAREAAKEGRSIFLRPVRQQVFKHAGASR